MKTEGGVLVIREGKAPEVNNPVGASHSGYTIKAPYLFHEKISSHREGVERSAIVSVDRTDGTLVLDVDPHDALAPTIHGSLVLDHILKGLGLNSAKRWTADDLVNYLRQYPQIVVLPEGESVRSFTRKFSDLKFAVTKEVEKSNDDRGNVVDNFLQRITSDQLPKTLKVQGLIHKGGTPHEFEVEIGLEATQRSISFYFFSTEYEFARQKEADDLLNAEIANFTKAQICVIETN